MPGKRFVAPFLGDPLQVWRKTGVTPLGKASVARVRERVWRSRSPCPVNRRRDRRRGRSSRRRTVWAVRCVSRLFPQERACRKEVEAEAERRRRWSADWSCATARSIPAWPAAGGQKAFRGN